MRAPCAWCEKPIPPNARRDSICCSQRCRQARHRFQRAVGAAEAAAAPKRLAYADPPYPGLAARYYGGHRDFAGEVDLAALIEQLVTYDGWALSTSANALREVLALCPAGARVAAWHRGERPHGVADGPLSAWEPVIFQTARTLRDVSRGSAGDASCAAENDASLPAQSDASRRTDSLVFVARPRRSDPGHVIGAKPAVFCRWVFELLGGRAGDSLDDLFPGSGGVGRAWDSYTRSTPTLNSSRSFSE